MGKDVQAFLVAVGITIVLAAIALLIWPWYNVWRQSMSGLGRLKEAESSRKIAIEEAHAKLESAKMLADAEIERAKGVAEANRIIGDSLQDNDAYLRYLWVQGLNDGSSEVIYVPTEANLPILEAGQRRRALVPVVEAP